MTRWVSIVVVSPPLRHNIKRTSTFTGPPNDRHHDHTEDLRSHDWYHGGISKDDAYALVVAGGRTLTSWRVFALNSFVGLLSFVGTVAAGSFLVRLSSRAGTFVVTWYRSETAVIHTLCTYVLRVCASIARY
jgi:hypothetical protein